MNEESTPGDVRPEMNESAMPTNNEQNNVSGTTVFVVESGDYEQRSIRGVFSSLEAAVAHIRKPYANKCSVRWGEPTLNQYGDYTLTGYFAYPPGYFSYPIGYGERSQEQEIDWEITPYPLDADN